MKEDAIIKDLAGKFDALRIKKQMKDTDIEAVSGVSRKTLYNFRKGISAISMKSFIRLLRSIDELDRLENLLTDVDKYSPMNEPVKKLPKRVRSSNARKSDFKWGDEE
ncbi:MAG TPA: hypothetical protein DCO79_10860 [Spirochaeta sp.]|nr:hypothetical protein [Spirochaeta sp.]